MTEKITRRGVKVPNEYTADFLDQKIIKFYASRNVISISASEKLSNVLNWLLTNGTRHHTFPVLENYKVVGVITKKDLEDIDKDENSTIKDIISNPSVVLAEGNSNREAADLMAEYGIYSIPIVENFNSIKLTGIISRHDVLRARKEKIAESKEFE